LSIDGEKICGGGKGNFHFRRRLGKKLRLELEDLLTALEKLRNDTDEETIILVEGAKDKRALSYMGITGRILSLSEFNRIMKRASFWNFNRVIILLDFDEEGRRMAKRTRTRLEEQGVKVDFLYYQKLSEARRFGINTIEELGRYLAKHYTLGRDGL